MQMVLLKITEQAVVEKHKQLEKDMNKKLIEKEKEKQQTSDREMHTKLTKFLTKPKSKVDKKDTVSLKKLNFTFSIVFTTVIFDINSS